MTTTETTTLTLTPEERTLVFYALQQEAIRFGRAAADEAADAKLEERDPDNDLIAHNQASKALLDGVRRRMTGDFEGMLADYEARRTSQGGAR